MKKFYNFTLFTLLTLFLGIFTSCSGINENHTGSVIFKVDKTLVEKIVGGGSTRAVTSQRGVVSEAVATSGTGADYYLDFTISGDYSDSKTILLADGESVQFENIPVGAVITCSCVVYYLKSVYSDPNYLFKGISDSITVKAGENYITIVLKRIGDDSSSDPQTIIYTLNFNADGNTVATQNLEFGSKANTVEFPTKAGYVFNGWYNGDTKFDFNTQITENMTLTAKWLTSSKFVSVTGATVSEGVDGSSVFISSRNVEIPNMYVCDHEVTQAEYETYCKYGSNSPRTANYGNGDNYPVYYINWYDAIVYCNLRSIAEGLTPVYSINEETDPRKWPEVGSGDGKYCGPLAGDTNSNWDAVTFNTTANGYRLPTEAEWEYVARGGNNGIPETQYSYSGSDTIDDVAWYSSNSSSKTHEVRTKIANTLGIYDMTGNVWELCFDWYSDTITTDTPFSGSISGSTRTIRGGSYYNNVDDGCNLSYRGDYDPFKRSFDTDYYGVGFRVVRNASIVQIPLNYESFTCSAKYNESDVEQVNSFVDMFDNNNETKMCLNVQVKDDGTIEEGSLSIYFNVDSSYTVTRYSFTPGGDTYSYQNRNPSAWTLYGKSGEDWVELEDNDPALSTDATEQFIELWNPASYQYYKLEITKLSGGADAWGGGLGCVQLAELKFYGLK